MAATAGGRLVSAPRCDFGFFHGPLTGPVTLLPGAEVARYANAYAELAADALAASGIMPGGLEREERALIVAQGVTFARTARSDWAVCPACLTRWREYQVRFPPRDGVR